MIAAVASARPVSDVRLPSNLLNQPDHSQRASPTPIRVANTPRDLLLDIIRDTGGYLSGQRTVANRADMQAKIAPLIQRQLQSGNGFAGLDLRAMGTGPSIVFSDGYAMSVHELPAMARRAGMAKGNGLVMIRDGMSGLLSSNKYDTYQQLVWASRNTGLFIEVVTDGRSWTFTPDMNSRPRW
jgi:hypothetical protein